MLSLGDESIQGTGGASLFPSRWHSNSHGNLTWGSVVRQKIIFIQCTWIFLLFKP